MSESCHHCQLELPDPPITDEEGHLFCCHGCRAVNLLITSSGLDHYYTLSEKFAGTQEATPAIASESEDWRNKERWLPYASPIQQEGWYEFVLSLEGLHCPACLWLIEEYLKRKGAGLQKIRVNLSLQKLTCVLDTEQHSLADLILWLGEVGYGARPLAPEEKNALSQAKRHQSGLLKKMAVAGFCTGNVMLLAAATYAGDFYGMDEKIRLTFDTLNFVLSLPVILYSATPFYQGFRLAYQQRSVTIDVPVCLGLWITFGVSLVHYILGSGEVYFDSVCAFTFTLMIGRFLEQSVRSKVGNILQELCALRPQKALCWEPQSKSWISKLTRELQQEDIILLSQDQRVPCDATITRGQAWLDESIVTGESLPISKAKGDNLISGTLVQEGELEAKVVATSQESFLAQVEKRIEEASYSLSPIQRRLDRWARYFLVWILVASGMAFVYHSYVGTQDPVMIAVSVLIITCPCALGIAGPLLHWATAGLSYRQGGIFTQLGAIDQLSEIDYLLLDKTGTLTFAKLSVDQFTTFCSDRHQDQILGAIAGLQAGNAHPLAQAIRQKAQDQGIENLPTQELTYSPGQGVEGLIFGERWLAGNREWLVSQGIEVNQENHSQSEVWVACHDKVVAHLTFADTLDPKAPEVLRKLQDRGVTCHIISGDRPEVVEETAKELGIALWDAQIQPQQKLEIVKRVQQQGHKVAMVGDGVNDTMALQQADVGISVGQAARLAQSVAPLVLIRNGIEVFWKLYTVTLASKRVWNQNIAFAIAYNCITIPCAWMGWVEPLLAAVAMPISSLLVVWSSLDLERTWKWKYSTL